MKVMTFNIQSGRKHPDFSVLNLNFCAEVIKKYMPDIVGLNEVHNGGEYGNQFEILAKKLGYSYYYFAEAFIADSPYGNAILSKYPIKSAETIMIPDPLIKNEDVYYETRCVLNAKITIEEKNISVLVSHFGLANSEQNNAVNTVCGLIGENSKNTILMGDFNMHPDNARLNEIRNRLVDTAIDPDESYFTFDSINPTEKIDYIFVSSDAKISDTKAIPDIGSDHRAYMTDIEF